MEEKEYNQFISNKYKALRKRSFKSSLDLYLFHIILNSESKELDSESFIDFNPSDQLIKEYEDSWQIINGPIKKGGPTVEELDKEFKWFKENKSQMESFEKAYQAYFNTILSVEDLKELYPIDQKIRVCQYCETSESDLIELRVKGLIRTKRYTRGWTLEIDRIEPNKEYNKDNLILACYWCNQAKTDEFSHDEFIPVGKVIGEIWKKRKIELDKP